MKIVGLRLFKYCAMTAIIMVFVCFWNVSCKSGKPLIASPNPEKIIVIQHDTIRQPKKQQLTSEQINNLLYPIYKSNFDRLFSPEFKRQNETIEKLTQSLHDLSENQKLRQHRTDSIVQERNTIRELYLNALDTARFYQKQALGYQSELLNGQKLAAKQNDTQISKINTVVNYILIGGISLFLVIVVMAVSLILLWRRNTKLYKKITNV